jgi:hypothetical protein
VKSPATCAAVFVGATRFRQNEHVVTWKAHALANPIPDQLDLDRGDTVRSTVELPGVPIGTNGKVILANGFNWLRYRVHFDNGVEVADLDGRQLDPVGRTVRRVARRAKQAR